MNAPASGSGPEILRVGSQPPLVIRGAFERTIEAGGVVLFPADTVYGLACDPLRADAIARIHAIKGRDDGKPSAVMYFSPLAMRELLGGLGERAREAVARLLPGPVTLVIDNPQRRYPLACADAPDRLGIRLIEGPLAGARVAVLQTSANPSGATPPSRPEDFDRQLAASVDLIIDAGELAGSPSTVIDISTIDSESSLGAWSILREGALDAAKVAKALG